MDYGLLQKQVQDLWEKVDALQALVQELPRDSTHPEPLGGASPFAPWTALPPEAMVHKDVLQDESLPLGFWTSSLTTEATADIQIRRLTTQLTAAYRRIALLEEQVMAQRQALALLEGLDHGKAEKDSEGEWIPGNG